MIRGKALLIIERTDSKYRKYSVDVHVKTCSSEHCYAQEDILCQAERDPPCTNLKVGERVWVWVVYRISYHRYEDWYSGGFEVDVEVEYPKIRVLKRSKPDGRYYKSPARP